jgi:hypothetical protein
MRSPVSRFQRVCICRKQKRIKPRRYLELEKRSMDHLWCCRKLSHENVELKHVAETMVNAAAESRGRLTWRECGIATGSA